MCMQKQTNNSKKSQVAIEYAGKYDTDGQVFECVMIVTSIFYKYWVQCTIILDYLQMYPKRYHTVPCEIICVP
jgi:hypothetical protein